MPVSFHDSLFHGSRELKLRCGLLVYYAAGVGVHVTSHDVELPEDGGAPMLMGGAPLSRELADLLARQILGGTVTGTILPECVVGQTAFRLAWWTPARRARIWFSRKELPHLQHLTRKDVLHPPLLWVAEADAKLRDRGRLHIYALAENRRPGNDTPVYQAPYFNVYPDGWACPGQVRWPHTLDPAAIPEWEAGFLDSEGSHCCAAELTRFPGGHDALWAAMLAAEAFPTSALVPTQWTALDVLNQDRTTRYGWDVPEQIVPATPAALGSERDGADRELVHA